jgi:predicted ArsR family transcriptional regulator
MRADLGPRLSRALLSEVRPSIVSSILETIVTSLEALGDGNRLAIARRLREAPESSAPELARATRLHLNTVRAHLGALGKAGFVERFADSEGHPGRPVVRYRLRRDVAPEDDAFLPLAGLVAAAFAETRPRARELNAAGAAWGRRLAERRQAGEPGDCLCRGMEELGFNASVTGHRLKLSGCPCSLIAPERPELVCGLAEGAIEGLLEASPTRPSKHEHDPVARRCSTLLRES